jgi:hypothetical protein
MKEIKKAIENQGLEVLSITKIDGDIIAYAEWKENSFITVASLTDKKVIVSTGIILEYRDLPKSKLIELLSWQHLQENSITVAMEPTGNINVKGVLICESSSLEGKLTEVYYRLINAAIEIIKIIKNPITNPICLN